MYLNGSEAYLRWWLIVVSLECFTSFCYWSDEIALPNQNSVFQKCEPAVYARLGFGNDDNGTLTKTLSFLYIY